MGTFVNLAGFKFDRLQVLRENGRSKHGKVLWLCICDCGNETTISGNSLQKGNTRSCGCMKKEMYDKLHENLIDLIGMKFGRLTVLNYAGTRGKFHFWNCLCDCGKEKEIIGSSLRGKITNSCGCLLSETSRVRFKKHGHSIIKSTEYKCWKGITQRCNNPKNRAYGNYGGRGIEVCERWLNSFEKFLDDMGNKPSPRHSIERNDVNGNYEPSNCRWATFTEQARNRRKQITNTSGVSGITWNQKLSQWMVRISVSNERIYLGMFTDKQKAIEERLKAEIKYWNKLPS